VLGPERMPEVLRTAGKLMRELRAASNTVMRELSEGLDDPNRPPVSRPELTDNARRRIAALAGGSAATQPPPETPGNGASKQS